MTPSVDCACSNLFCSEEVLEGSYDTEYCFDEQKQYVHLYPPSPVPGDSLDVDESISALAEKELHHLPKHDYLQRLQDQSLDARAREDAVRWLLKVQAHYNFGPLTLALSVNYFDRFLSRHPVATSEKAWMVQLLTVACLSLAAKIEETEVPLLIDLQVQGAQFIFEPRTIQRMELVVLSTLEWRLSSVTPFSYIDFFLRKLAVEGYLKHAVVARINELLLNTLQDIRFLAHKPSVVAIAAALYAVDELLPNAIFNCTTLLTALPNLKDSSTECLRLMEENFVAHINARPKRKLGSGASVPPSPSGVLDASFDCDSESTMRSLESSPSVEHLVSSIAVKKQRRGDDFCSGNDLPM